MSEKTPAEESAVTSADLKTQGGAVVTRKYVEALEAWYGAAKNWNNVVAGEKLPRGRHVFQSSVWLSDSGTTFTASLRAREKGKSDREWVLYTTATSPFDAIRLLAAAARDEATAWREKPVVDRAGSNGAAGSLPDPMAL